MRFRNLLVFGLLFCVFAADSQEAPEPINSEYSGKQNSDWEKIQQDLGTIKGKLESQTALIKNLIETKHGLKGEALDQKLEETKKEYLRLQKYTDDFNKLNQDYLTKFPERGTKQSRTYKRLKPKTLQAFENELTVQGMVNRLHGKIINQYPDTNVVVKKYKVRASSQDSSGTEKINKDDVTEQIKLKK